MRRASRVMSVTGVGILVLAGAASANITSPQTYGFVGITPNRVLDTSIGEAQLAVQISEVIGEPQALFTFSNSGPLQSTISEVYFQDGTTLLGLADIINHGTKFVQYAAPPDLPDGQPVGFQVHPGFLAEAAQPPPKNGVNPGDSVDILFNLQANKTYSDVIHALNLGLTQGAVADSLRIGIHVINFGDDQSASFITGRVVAVPAVPVPASAVLVPVGLGMIGLLKRRRLAGMRD